MNVIFIYYFLTRICEACRYLCYNACRYLCYDVRSSLNLILSRLQRETTEYFKPWVTHDECSSSRLRRRFRKIRCNRRAFEIYTPPTIHENLLSTKNAAAFESFLARFALTVKFQKSWPQVSSWFSPTKGIDCEEIKHDKANLTSSSGSRWKRTIPQKADDLLGQSGRSFG